MSLYTGAIRCFLHSFFMKVLERVGRSWTHAFSTPTNGRFLYVCL